MFVGGPETGGQQTDPSRAAPEPSAGPDEWWREAESRRGSSGTELADGWRPPSTRHATLPHTSAPASIRLCYRLLPPVRPPTPPLLPPRPSEVGAEMFAVRRASERSLIRAILKASEVTPRLRWKDLSPTRYLRHLLHFIDFWVSGLDN